MEFCRSAWFWVIFVWLAGAPCLAQLNEPSSVTAPAQQQSSPQSASKPNEVQGEGSQSTLEKMKDLPIVWLIGPYIPSTRPLRPLTTQEREEVYLRQTFLTVGSYFARAFTAGIDQARGVPYEWDDGIDGYGQRFGSRYGQYVIANTLRSAGNAALGYESRYDLCRCTGFWPRTRHAVGRNFVTYNRTERERRPQIPLYGGAFASGMISTTWLPGQRNVWAQGAYSALIQAGFGSTFNFVSEFSFDILHKLGIRKQYGR